MSDFLQRLEREIQNRRLFKRGEKILAAVSGGLDSMVLLHALSQLSARHQWQLVVAHFNHRLRGRAGDADERLVRRIAAQRKLPLVTGRGDVRQFAETSKMSLEMAARKLRHEFFVRAARQRQIQVIALAHQADDQVELFFLRLLRGAGSEGLAGMKWRAPSPADSRMVLVRPLLGFAKAELLAFARENQIRFREDATNFSTDILRNRIRHQLLPLLREKYQPALTRTILRTMELLGAEEEWIGEMARDWLQRSGQPAPLAARRTQRRALDPDFDALPAALQRRILHQQLVNIGIAADFELVESLRRAPGMRVSVARNLCAVRDERGFVKLRAAEAPEFNSRELAVALTAPAGRAGEAVFGGIRLQWRIRPRKAAPVRLAARRGNQEFFDADQVGERIVLRHWRPGDRFQPIGLKAPAKLQDLFVNAKIPARQRRQLVVAESAGGEIFWVEGLRIGERFKLTPQTRRSLLWRWRSAEGFSSPEKPLQPDRQ